jgi:hypothetical protein
MRYDVFSLVFLNFFVVITFISLLMLLLFLVFLFFRAFVGFMVQIYKCMAWYFFSLPPSFFFLLSIFVALQIVLGFWVSHLVLPLLFLHFDRIHWIKMFAMYIYAFEVKRNPSSFWNLFGVSLKKIPICFIPSPLLIFH